MYTPPQNAVPSSFMPTTEPNPADAALAPLLEKARQAALNSYSPYSRFRVGAALKLTNGAVVTGTNVENVSYSLTICAERSALVAAVSQFGPDIRVQAVLRKQRANQLGKIRLVFQMQNAQRLVHRAKQPRFEFGNVTAITKLTNAAKVKRG